MTKLMQSCGARDRSAASGHAGVLFDEAVEFASHSGSRCGVLPAETVRSEPWHVSVDDATSDDVELANTFGSGTIASTQRSTE